MFEILFLSQTVLFSIIQLVLLYFWYQDKQQSSEERRELYDRLQAGTLTDFKANTDTQENEIEDTGDEEVVPIEDAREDIANEEGSQ